MIGRLLGRHRISAIVGLVITVALIWWTVRDVSLAALIDHLGRTNLGLLALAIAVAMSTVPLRVPRWRSALWQHPGVSSRSLFHAIVLGFLGNNVLPARTGEVLRAYALSRLSPVSGGTALGSIALERVLDLLAIAVLVLVGIAVEGARVAERSALPVAHVAAVTIGVIAAIVVAGAVLTWRPRRLVRLIHGALRTVLPERTAVGFGGLLERVAAGFAAVRSPRRVLSLFAWSLLIWTVNAAAFWIGFEAFDIHVSWTAAVLVQGTVALGIALPSSPGFFGPFEAATRVALTSYGVPPTAAAAFAVPFHLSAYFVPVTLLGFWSLWITGVSLRAGAAVLPTTIPDVGMVGSTAREAPGAGLPDGLAAPTQAPRPDRAADREERRPA